MSRKIGVDFDLMVFTATVYYNFKNTTICRETLEE